MILDASRAFEPRFGVSVRVSGLKDSVDKVDRLQNRGF